METFEKVFDTLGKFFGNPKNHIYRKIGWVLFAGYVVCGYWVILK